MTDRIASAPGFIAALDQSGGSTPKALSLYGVEPSDYDGEEAMFAEVQAMRARIMQAPDFTSEKVIGAILFERTMGEVVGGKPVPAYLWEDRGVVPFLKVDKGLADEENGVQMMKDMPDLAALLERAKAAGVFGTKMRSVIHDANAEGIKAVVAQQFAIGDQIRAAGLVPIIEPEVNIHSATKAEAEAILRDELAAHIDAMEGEGAIMLKLTLPSEAGLYAGLQDKVLRVVALSGGYSTDEACAKLADNPGMIASFSRALTEGLSKQMSDAEFNAALGANIDKIYRASV
ncbi:fructose bisphosphate aldolase [Aestuariivita boseongensis]|uniref:fructose bisphosphate aldolase n=1 Tax=Aestuariivita boseongensis TaxID=1470562 RepID=UPI0012F8BD7F|nr:fructose bisphosphate aldolase [Aestuariivita boseongensis]